MDMEPHGVLPGLAHSKHVSFPTSLLHTDAHSGLFCPTPGLEQSILSIQNVLCGGPHMSSLMSAPRLHRVGLHGSCLIPLWASGIIDITMSALL